jgi:hypothetical protein
VLEIKDSLAKFNKLYPAEVRIGKTRKKSKYKLKHHEKKHGGRKNRHIERN